MSGGHSKHDSQSTAYSENVDSSTTTFVGSPHSAKSDGFFDQGEYDSKADGKRNANAWRNAGSDDDDDDDDNESLLADESEPLVVDTGGTDGLRDDEPPPPPLPLAPKQKEKPIAWSQLPKKSQLAILTLARLSEPLAATSLQSYVFYQLKSFKLPDGSTPSDETVATQAGLLAASFTAAQFLTAMFWGRMADWDRMGRKRCILIGLLGSATGSLGFGFSQSFLQAVFWRCVAGFLNGNIGVMRTMISEIIKEKKFQSRAFLLLPMTFNVGVIIGPLLGGLLADPVGSYPSLFGPGGAIGGDEGVWWLQKWPYALPNVVNAVFLFSSAMALVLGLEETLEALRDRPDYGLRFSRWVGRTVFRIKSKQEYVPLAEHDGSEQDMEAHATAKTNKKSAIRRKLPFRRIWTSNVLLTLLSHGLLAMHVGTFNSLWFVYLSTSRYDPDSSSTHSTRSAAEHTEPLKVPKNYHVRLPLQFTGGLALPPPSIGTALAILGVIGLSLQLLLYPRLSFRLGTIRSLRYSLLLFPLTYTLVPFLSIIPSTRPPPGQASGILVWMGITLVLCIQVMARTFALPSNAILVNNSSPHPSVLGTLHGIGQSVSSGFRTIGPAMAGWIYAVGLRKGIVGLAWWCMAGVAIIGAIAGRLVKEGDGHEIWLEGEKEELKREERR